MTIKSIRTGWTGISANAGNPIIGNFESIATATVGAGATATDVTFSSIPSTYQHLQIRYLTRTNSTVANDTNAVGLQFNTDTNNNYAAHLLYGTGASALASASASIARLFAGYANSNNYSATNYTANVVDILDYKNTNKNTTVRTLCGNDGNGAGFVLLVSGLWMNTNAVDSIKLFPTTSVFAEYSHFALYGIR